MRKCQNLSRVEYWFVCLFIFCLVDEISVKTIDWYWYSYWMLGFVSGIRFTMAQKISAFDFSNVSFHVD